MIGISRKLDSQNAAVNLVTVVTKTNDRRYMKVENVEYFLEELEKI